MFQNRGVGGLFLDNFFEKEHVLFIPAGYNILNLHRACARVLFGAPENDRLILNTAESPAWAGKALGRHRQAG